MIYSKKYPIGYKEPYNETTFFIKENNYTCRRCGQKAEFIYKRHNSSGFNYGYNVETGIDHLTLDHLIPKSIGGSNSMKNMQVLCQNCNGLKGSSIVEQDLELFFDRCKNDWRYKKTANFYLFQDLYYTYQISLYSFICEVLYCYNVIDCFYPKETEFGRCVKIDNSFLQRKKQFFETKTNFSKKRVF